MENLTLILRTQDLATKTIKRVREQVNRLNNVTQNVAKQGFRTMQNTWQSTSSFIAGSIPALTAGFIGISGVILKMASDSQETRNRFNAVFGDMANGVNTFAIDLSRATGRASDQVRSGLSAYQSMAIGLGFAQDKAVDFSKELQKLQIDFGSFNNLSDQEVMDRFIAAMSGSSEVLDQFGVNIKATALDRALLSKGFPTIAKGATEAQKAIARLDIIKETMGRQGAIGDAVRTSNDFANQLRRLQSIGIDYAIAIGSRLVPAGEAFLGWVFEVLPTLDEFNGLLDKGQKFISNWVQKGIEYASPLIEKMGGETQVLNGVLAGLAGVTTAIVIPSIIGLIASMIALTWPFILIGVLVAGLYIAWQNNFLGMQDTVTRFVEVGWRLLMVSFQWFMENVWPALEVAFFLFKSFIDQQLIPAVQRLYRTFMLELLPALMDLWNFIQPVIIPILKLLSGIILGVLVVSIGILLASVMGLITVLEWLAKTVSWVINSAKKTFNDFQNVMERVFNVPAVENLINNLNRLKNTAIDVKNAVSGVISGGYHLGRGMLPSFDVGTSHFAGGLAQVHKDEILDLPAGTKVRKVSQSDRMRENLKGGDTYNISINVENKSPRKMSKAEQLDLVNEMSQGLEQFFNQRKLA